MSVVDGSYVSVDALRAKLDEMTLQDDTGDPVDDGYMGAVDEMKRWTDALTRKDAQ